MDLIWVTGFAVANSNTWSLSKENNFWIFLFVFVRPPFYTITNHQRGTGISLVQIAFCMRSENRFTINSLIWHSERGWRIRHPGMMKLARKSGRPMRMTTFDCLNLAARLSIGITYRSLTRFEFQDLWWVSSRPVDMQGAVMLIALIRQGNAHVVYNGSFYYHEKDSSKVVRFDLESSKPVGMFFGGNRLRIDWPNHLLIINWQIFFFLPSLPKWFARSQHSESCRTWRSLAQIISTPPSTTTWTSAWMIMVYGLFIQQSNRITPTLWR